MDAVPRPLDAVPGTPARAPRVVGEEGRGDEGGRRGLPPWLRSATAAAGAWLSTEHWVVGAGLARLVLGAWAVYYYLLHYPVRAVLWGPHGVWPYAKFLEVQSFFTVWQLGASTLLFEAIYHAAILIAVAFTLGVLPPVTGALHWWMIWSLQERNPLLGDGGDNIMRIILLFLVLVNTGAHFSAAPNRLRAAPATLFRRLRAVAHNLGVLLIIAQLILLYASTGLYKVMGELWQNGTALYYILRVGEFSWPGVAEAVFRNPYLVVLGTYGTMGFELLFTPALFSRWTRYAAIMAGVAFHLGIAVFMGLLTFGWSMLSIYPLLVTDREYRALAAFGRRRLALTVLYDGWCPFCTRSIRLLRALDLFSVVAFVSFRDPGAVERYDLDARRAVARIQSVRGDGTIREGMDVLLQIGWRSPLLWAIVPLLLLARLLAGQRAYDALAARRFVLVPGTCVDHCSLERG